LTDILCLFTVAVLVVSETRFRAGAIVVQNKKAMPNEGMRIAQRLRYVKPANTRSN
jgi:hypothetical protein